MICTAWTKAVKLSLLHGHKIEFCPGMISEEIDWYLHLMCYAKTYDSINDVGIIYHQRHGPISHVPKINSMTDNLWFLENWPTHFNENIIVQSTFNLFMSVMTYYFANDLVLFTYYNSAQIKPYKKHLKAQSYMLDYVVTPWALTIKKSYKLFGFHINSRIRIGCGI